MQISELQPIDGVILAGGLARRMGGGDKGLRLLAGQPVLGHVIARLQPQVTELILNANGDPGRFASFGLPVTPDSISDHPGPLAGILAGLDYLAAQRSTVGWLVTAPGDCPFLPADLVSRLVVGLQPACKAAVARYRQRLQPVCGLWSVALRADLRQAVVEDGVRRVEDWLQRCEAARVDFPEMAVDPFFNVNSPDDLEAAAALLVQPPLR